MTDNSITPTTVSAAEKILTGASHFLSFIFSPLLVPTYALILACSLSYMSLLPISTLAKVTLTIFAITCLIPLIAIGILYKTGKVSDPGLNKQGERTIPFMISGVSYAIVFGYLLLLHAPSWLSMFAASGFVIVTVACIINFKWKISIHLAGMGGLLGMLTHLMATGEVLHPVMPWLLWAIIATGAVGTARLMLQRHTLLQVAAGTALGLITTVLMMMIKL